MHPLALLLLIPIILFLKKWLDEIDRQNLLARYADISEPIFEASRSPEDTEVVARAERHRDLLRRAGNRWKPPVFVCLFGEPPFYGETWPDFLARCRDFENEQMNVWLARARADDAAVFWRVSMRQKAA